MTPEEVLPLLAHSIEMDSPKEIENYQILCEAGERAYPAMAKILLDGKVPDVIRSIIPFFVNSKGDKTIPLQAMSKYVEMHAKNPPVNQEICALFIAFGEIGGANDVKFLKQFLDIEDPIIRDSIEGNIERIEKRLAAEKRRADTNERHNRRSTDEIPEKLVASENFESRSIAFSTIIIGYWKWLLGGCVLTLIIVYIRMHNRRYTR